MSIEKIACKLSLYRELNSKRPEEGHICAGLGRGDKLSGCHDPRGRSILLEFVSETVPSFSSIDLRRHQVTRVLAHSVYCSDRLLALRKLSGLLGEVYLMLQ
jgi:hypothetical protein